MTQDMIRKRADELAAGDRIAFSPRQTVTVERVTGVEGGNYVSVHYVTDAGAHFSRRAMRAARYVLQ